MLADRRGRGGDARDGDDGRQVEMGGDEALQRVRRQRLLGMIERENFVRRRFRRRIGEFLAVGKNAVELDVVVEVAEQDLRRRGPLERKRRMGDEKDRGERDADSRFHAPAGMR